MEARGRSGLNGEMTTTAPLSAGSALILATGLGCALVAGVFFAFSSFVMRALDRLPPDAAITAMQSINVTAVRPLFMVALFGTGLSVVAVLVTAIRNRDDHPLGLLLIGAALYLIGTIGLTVVHHVPLNDALARLDPDAADAAARWAAYSTGWTRANHLRTGTALAAAAVFFWSLLPD